MNSFPKISIVTPVYNQSEFIERTILSVINQGYPNLEYIIIDGDSKDGTVDVIKKYDGQIAKWISEPDSGMYDAINKGFSYATGDIMGWINADDILLPSCLVRLGKLFSELADVQWVQGLNTIINEKDEVIERREPRMLSFMHFLKGDFKWVQQESTFWTKSLWDKAGGYVSTELRLAGDFELWFRFFQYEKLYFTSEPLGAWRRRSGQLSDVFRDKYYNEVNDVIENHKLSLTERKTLFKIESLQKIIQYTGGFNIFKRNLFHSKLNGLFGINNTRIKLSQEDKFYLEKN